MKSSQLYDLAVLIDVRNFAAGSIDNLSLKITNDEVRKIQSKVAELNKLILNEIINLDLSKLNK